MTRKYRTKRSRKESLGKYVIFGVLGFVLVVILYLANFIIKSRQSIYTGAAVGNASLFFEPSSVTIPPNGTVNLWITATQKVGFSAVDLSFDPALIKLAGSPTLTSTVLTRVIKQTSVSEANSTGKFSLVIAVDPTTLASAPTGSFKIATLTFASATTLADKTSSLAFTSTQLVDVNATPFAVTTQNVSFTLNPTQAIAASPKVTLTSTSAPTATSVPTKVPTTTPSVTQNVDTTSPTLTITSEKFWWFDYVKVVASDASGIESIVMVKDTKVVKSCSNSSQCVYYYSSSTPRPFTILATATDKSTNQNVGRASITVR
jgi:hypothetical protein